MGSFIKLFDLFIVTITYEHECDPGLTETAGYIMLLKLPPREFVCCVRN